MPENCFDSVQIGVSNDSKNKRGVKIECLKNCNMKYGHHTRAEPLYTVDYFIDSNRYTKWESRIVCILFCQVRQRCTMYISPLVRTYVRTPVGTPVTVCSTVRGSVTPPTAFDAGI